MKTIFMGTPEFAVPALQGLIHSSHEVVAVYTQPARPAGRGKQPRPSPVQQLAEAHRIPVYTPESLKSPEIQNEYKAHHADVAVVAAYGLLLPKPILEACPHGCINIHPSRLPRWRGAAPIQRTIMAGDTQTAICIMQMEEGLDTGPVLMQENIPVPEKATAGELHDLLAERSVPLLLQTLDQMAAGAAKATPQAEEGVTYAKKICKEEAQIDWNQSADILYYQVQGLSPYPGAFFIHNGEKIKILQAEWSNQQTGMVSGTIVDDCLTIACRQGVLHPLLLQRAGKKPMETADFLRGYVIPQGTVLG